MLSASLVSSGTKCSTYGVKAGRIYAQFDDFFIKAHNDVVAIINNVIGAFAPETSLELGSFKSLTNSLGSQNKDLESRIWPMFARGKFWQWWSPKRIELTFK